MKLTALAFACCLLATGCADDTGKALETLALNCDSPVYVSMSVGEWGGKSITVVCPDLTLPEES